MSFKFLLAFGKKTVVNASDDLATMLINFDPETAEEIQIEALEKALDDQLKAGAEAEQDYRKEQAEAIAIQKLQDSKIQAAETLSARLESATKKSDKEAIETSLGKLLTDIENMQADVDREVAEALQAKEIWLEYQAADKELAEQVKNARKMFEDLRRNKKSADIKKQRAERQAENAAKLAGIRNGGDRMNKVMEVMQKNVDKANAEAAAATRKADLLKPAPSVTEDPLIAEALSAANGTTAAPVSMKDRLAALKSKKTTA